MISCRGEGKTFLLELVFFYEVLDTFIAVVLFSRGIFSPLSVVQYKIPR